MSAMSSDDKATNEYRIDDLARVAGTTTRNVRGYQDRGLLPRPVRRGRIAIYTDLHLDLGAYSPVVRWLGKERRLKRPSPCSSQLG